MIHQVIDIIRDEKLIEISAKTLTEKGFTENTALLLLRNISFNGWATPHMKIIETTLETKFSLLETPDKDWWNE